jgi:hypothetical protein
MQSFVATLPQAARLDSFATLLGPRGRSTAWNSRMSEFNDHLRPPVPPGVPNQPPSRSGRLLAALGLPWPPSRSDLSGASQPGVPTDSGLSAGVSYRGAGEAPQDHELAFDVELAGVDAGEEAFSLALTYLEANLPAEFLALAKLQLKGSSAYWQTAETIVHSYIQNGFVPPYSENAETLNNGPQLGGAFVSDNTMDAEAAAFERAGQYISTNLPPALHDLGQNFLAASRPVDYADMALGVTALYEAGGFVTQALVSPMGAGTANPALEQALCSIALLPADIFKTAAIWLGEVGPEQYDEIVRIAYAVADNPTMAADPPAASAERADVDPIVTRVVEQLQGLIDARTSQLGRAGSSSAGLAQAGQIGAIEGVRAFFVSAVHNSLINSPEIEAAELFQQVTAALRASGGEPGLCDLVESWIGPRQEVPSEPGGETSEGFPPRSRKASLDKVVATTITTVQHQKIKKTGENALRLFAKELTKHNDNSNKSPIDYNDKAKEYYKIQASEQWELSPSLAESQERSRKALIDRRGLKSGTHYLYDRAEQNGFPSYADYQKQLMKKNGFDSRANYLKHLAEKKRYNSLDQNDQAKEKGLNSYAAYRNRPRDGLDLEADDVPRSDNSEPPAGMTDRQRGKRRAEPRDEQHEPPPHRWWPNENLLELQEEAAGRYLSLGASQLTIAQDYGVYPTTIGHWVRNFKEKYPDWRAALRLPENAPDPAVRRSRQK